MNWTDDSIKAINKISENACHLAWCEAMVADIVRLEILYLFGGVYVDSDTECVRPIDDLLIDDFIISECSKGNPLNGFMGSTAKHPLILNMLSDLLSRFHRFNNIHNITGSDMIKEHIKRFGCDNVTMLPSHYFYCEPNVYVRHHWDYSWRGKESNPIRVGMLL